ncbi:MAG TPA: hypothetical protein DCQ29_01160 [Chitinophagaceae bacterium]|nr:hypothetical protein [Chitinophagaceae bacterium]
MKNIDGDAEEELIILTSADFRSPRFATGEFIGSFYDVFVYDNLLSNKDKLKNISSKFPEFNGQEDGYWVDKATNKRSPIKSALFKKIYLINKYLDWLKSYQNKVLDPVALFSNEFASLYEEIIKNKPKGYKISEDKENNGKYIIERLITGTKIHYNSNYKTVAKIEYYVEGASVADIQKQLKSLKANYYPKDEGYTGNMGSAVWLIEPCYRCRYKMIPTTKKIKFEYVFYCGE